MEDFLESIFLNEKNYLAKIKTAKLIIEYLQKNIATKKELIAYLKQNGFYKTKTLNKVLAKLKALQIIKVSIVEKKKHYVLSPDGFYFFFKKFYEKLKA